MVSMGGSATSVGHVVAYVLLLLGALGTSLWLMRHTLKETAQSPGCWFGAWYCLGAVVCILALLPGPELESLSADAGLGRWVLFAVGVAMVLIGATTHIAWGLQGRLADRKEERDWIAVALVVIPMGVVLQILRIYGLGRWLACFAGALLMLLLLGIAGCVLTAFLRTRNLPVNQMARLIQSQEYTKAIGIGESVPTSERSPPVELNLAAAYWHSGEKDRAEGMFEQLSARPGLYGPIRRAIADWMAEVSREEGVDGEAGP